MNPAAPSFEITGGTLCVTGDLGSEAERAFEEVLDLLVETGEAPLVVDLSDVRYLSSSYVRHIAKAMMEAKEKNLSMTVRAGRRVARLLSMGGLHKLGTVETTDEA